MKVGARGRKPIIIGCIYREFRYVLHPDSNESASDDKQLERWNIFISKWKDAEKMGDVMVIGDIKFGPL